MRELVEDLRGRARRLDACAGSLDEEALRLRRRTDVGWVSSDADEWRAALLALRRDVEDEADRLRDAAAQFRRHADEVEETLDAIAAAESWFRARLADARRTLAAGAETVGDAAVRSAQQLLDAARSSPSPGSLDWLHFGGRW